MSSGTDRTRRAPSAPAQSAAGWATKSAGRSPATSAFVAVLVLAAAWASGARALELRLDTTLAVATPGTVDARTETLVRFGAGDLSHRVEQVRDRARAYQARNQELAQRIERQEALLEQLRTLSSRQDVAIEGLRSTADAGAPATAAAPAGSKARARPLREDAPATAPITAVAAASASLASASVVRPPPAETATASPATATPGWPAEAGLIAAALALAGGGALLLARRRRDTSRGGKAPHEAAPVSTSEAHVPAAEPRTARARGEAPVPETSAAPARARDLDAAPGEATPEPTAPADERVGSGTLDLVLEPDTLDTGRPAPSATPAQQSGARPEPSTIVMLRPGAPEHGEEAGDESDGWSSADVQRKAADPQVLKEVDTLIAFEQYEKAKTLLDEMLEHDPQNPEYLLRHYHVRTHGGMDTCADDEDMLRAMMDGPLSDTLLRVRSIGRGLMPGDPLFRDGETREAAAQVLAGEAPAGKPAAGERTAADVRPADFDKTVVLRLVPMDC